MTIDTKYSVGEIIYLRVRDDKIKGMITSINIKPDSCIMYEVIWSDGNGRWHYEIELTTEYIPDYGAGINVDKNIGGK